MRFRITMLACAALLAAQTGWATDGFGDIFSGGETGAAENPAGVEVTGEIGLGLRYFLDEGTDSVVKASPTALLDIVARSSIIEGTIALNLEVDDDADPVALGDVIDELYLKAFFPFGYLTAGLFKTEWGKGDGTHVIDPLNPLVQKDGVQTDLFKMKRAEAMIMASLYLGERGLLELVYKPYFHPVQSDVEGRWATGAPDIPVPDMDTLASSQGAARLTATLGSFDLGILYYYGFVSEPGYEMPLFTMVFTRAHLFGFEGVTALGPFTVRTELGYWLTEDSAGDRPELYNDRFVYLGGIDLMAPGTNIFVSVQLTGSYRLDFPESPDIDVDRLASYDGKAHSTTIIASIEAPFARDTMKVRVSGLYLLEAKGYMIIPEYRWNIADDVQLLLYGQLFGGDETAGSPYSLWDKNDNIGLTVSYLF